MGRGWPPLSSSERLGLNIRAAPGAGTEALLPEDVSMATASLGVRERQMWAHTLQRKEVKVAEAKEGLRGAVRALAVQLVDVIPIGPHPDGIRCAHWPLFDYPMHGVTGSTRVSLTRRRFPFPSQLHDSGGQCPQQPQVVG